MVATYNFGSVYILKIKKQNLHVWSKKYMALTDPEIDLLLIQHAVQ